MTTRSEKTIADKLKDITDEELIIEVLRRGYDEEEGFYGAVYALGEMSNHRDNEIFGDSEAGLHGRESSKPTIKAAHEATDIA